MCPKFLLSCAPNHGRQCVSKDTEITILQDGMTVRLVTISVKSSPTLILHEPVLMNLFIACFPYLCSGYPRLASQELAFYHAYSGDWRNQCGILWPLPACHAEFLSVCSLVSVPLLCCGHLEEKSSTNLGLTLHFSKLANRVANDAFLFYFFKCIASLVWLFY